MNSLKKIEHVSPEQCSEAILALRDTMEIWGGKWKLMILLYLIIKIDDKNFFLQIVRDIPGISSKMLSKELKDLEVNNLVKRVIHDTKPITVEYSITDYGKAFLPVAENLITWGMEHRQIIKSK